MWPSLRIGPEPAIGNPHPMITLEVRTNDGRIEEWLVGGPALNRMERNGWTRTTVKSGDVNLCDADRITGIGYQFADTWKKRSGNGRLFLQFYGREPAVCPLVMRLFWA